MRYFIIKCLLLSVGLLSGCDRHDTEKNTDTKDRTPVLINWADNIIIPSYAGFKIRLDEMIAKADLFAEAPDNARLADLRSAWVEAYIEWEKAELFEFGPADKFTLRNFFNIYPANTAAIAENIADPSVNLDLPASYATQGFPALDYLINGVAGTDDEIVGFYTAAADGAARISYLVRLTTRMGALLGNVISEWETYRDVFVSKTGLDIGSPFALVVNSYVLHYERYIRSGKFGIPSGAMTTSGGTVFPEKVEALYKRDISRTLAKTAHQAAIDFFHGKSVTGGEDGPSFKSYLDALDARDTGSGTLLSEIIADQLSAAQDQIEPLSENLYQEVIDNNGAMLAVFTEMQKATRMLKVDMTSAMSITITYTDNDGD